ncbi:MAG: hypothetical protein LBL13_09430 [Bacteroidales bacterium]|jgi:hypothetical protein|nr:hypothetical protein [Bacteroidales bacterium]
MNTDRLICGKGFTNVLNSPEAIEVLAQYRYTIEKLNREFQDVSDTELLHSKYLGEKGVARQDNSLHKQIWHSRNIACENCH